MVFEPVVSLGLSRNSFLSSLAILGATDGSCEFSRSGDTQFAVQALSSVYLNGYLNGRLAKLIICVVTCYSCAQFWPCRSYVTFFVEVGFLMSRFFLAVVVFWISLSCFLAGTVTQAHDIANELHGGFQVLLKSLKPGQVEQVKFEFADSFRKDWQFVPMDRRGLAFDEMDTHQRLLAMAILQTALSHRGFSQSVQVMALEQVLHELENQNSIRDPGKYHFFLFGDPSLSESWGWRVEGHHLSLNFTIVGGQRVVATPAFIGSNPAEVRNGPMKGLRVLGRQEDLGRELVNSFSEAQQEKAIIAVKAPRDVINGPGRDAKPLEPKGLPYGEMNQDQQALLMKIVDCYLGRLRNELAEQDLRRIEAAGKENIFFAWAGSTVKGKPHYYAVQGPTFVMEYDNTQNKANHVHTVWRDLQNDFGVDWLKQHYQLLDHNSR